jgi:hypothetical protein
MLASGSSQSNIYSMENLCSQLIKKPLPFTFESCVKTAMKHFPIVLSESARILKHELPFCATSIKEFYSWSYAKRRANEWMRAVAIKNKCIKLAREYNNLIDTSVIPNDEHLTGYFNLVSLYNGSPVYRFYVNSNEFINLIWSILGYYTN